MGEREREREGGREGGKERGSEQERAIESKRERAREIERASERNRESEREGSQRVIKHGQTSINCLECGKGDTSFITFHWTVQPIDLYHPASQSGLYLDRSLHLKSALITYWPQFLHLLPNSIHPHVYQHNTHQQPWMYVVRYFAVQSNSIPMELFNATSLGKLITLPHLSLV